MFPRSAGTLLGQGRWSRLFFSPPWSGVTRFFFFERKGAHYRAPRRNSSAKRRVGAAAQRHRRRSPALVARQRHLLAASSSNDCAAFAPGCSAIGRGTCRVGFLSPRASALFPLAIFVRVGLFHLWLLGVRCAGLRRTSRSRSGTLSSSASRGFAAVATCCRPGFVGYLPVAIDDCASSTCESSS